MIKTLQRPSVTVNVMGTKSQIPNEAHRVLFVGELGNNGNGTTSTLYSAIGKGDAKILFGEDSKLNRGIEKFLSINTTNFIDAIAFPKGTSKSEGKIKIVGTSITDSNLTFTIAGYKFTIGIVSGETDTQILTKVNDKIVADLSDRFDSVLDNGEITVTYKQESNNNGNLITYVESKITGLTYTITNFAGGASTSIANDSLTSLNLNERYQSIIYDDVLGLDALKELTENRFNVNNAIMDGIGFTYSNKSLSDAYTELADINYKTIVRFYNLTEMNYNIDVFETLSEIVAIRALRLTDGTNISKYVLDSSETFGGINKCTLPYFNTPLNVGKPINRITEDQLIELNKQGGSTIVNNCAVTVLSEVVTTYKTNNIGSIDVSWKYLNYVDTMLTIREFFVNNLRSKYGQTRLTDGDLIPNVSITNKGAIKAFLVSLYDVLANKGSNSQVGITRAGYTKYFKDNLDISDDLTKGKISFSAKTPIVVQTRVINGVISEILDLKFEI